MKIKQAIHKLIVYSFRYLFNIFFLLFNLLKDGKKSIKILKRKMSKYANK